ncbi:VanZ family protein [Nocardiopsis algeriensis]|uniref:VanZ family protein n=1 Tax=Nocardiopsis algeriensis TaxID=1478215 RepID=A0A841ITJ5_9ACTN|nr:VanZ family protein [Nocardiopsis algeriensis]MBB6119508.1 VanZ family protein [Nocardiopsis algeriensis]
MWRVLFYVTPTSLTVALVFFFLLSWVLAVAIKKRGASFSRSARAALALAAFSYVFLLSILPLGGEQPGSGRLIHWNPLHFIHDHNSEGAIEESFGQQLSDGNTVYYSPDELPAEERSEIQKMSPYDFFAHGNIESGVIVSNPEGDVVPQSQGQHILTEISEAIEVSSEPVQSQGMILEEKSLNFLLFVPLGVLAYFSFSSHAARMATGPAVSLSIEVVQWSVAWGRTADTADLLANSLGSFLGVAMGMLASALAVLTRRSEINGGRRAASAGHGAGRRPRGRHGS